MVDLQVVAQGENGSNILQFKMKMTTTFGKMMARWCDHHRVPQEQACFLADDRELQPDDTPESIGWSPTRPGEERTVRAQPRSAPADVAAPAAPPRDKKGAKRGRDGQGGGSEPSVKRAATAYSLWAKQRRSRLIEERPELKGQLGELQRAVSAEWKVLPEEERRPFEEEAARDRRRRDSELAAAAANSQGAPAPPAAADLGTAAAASSSATAAAAAAPAPEAVAADTTLSVLVLAQGSDGPSELKFKVKMSTPLAKVMKAWCSHHEIPESEATFIWKARALLPEESPASLGHLPAAGDLAINAVPCDSPDAVAAQKALELDKPGIRAAIAAAKEVESKAGPSSQKHPADASAPTIDACTVSGHASVGGEANDSQSQPAAPSSPPPKRPLTAYLLFNNRRRPALLAERPELQGPRLGEVAKVLSSEWKELSEEGRRPFEEEAAKLREKYTEEKAAYSERHPATPKSGAGVRRKGSATSPGKKPKAAAGRRRASRKAGGGEAALTDDDGSGGADSDSSSGAASDHQGDHGLRRSARLRESPMAALASSVTIVHHPPPPSKRRRRKMDEAAEQTCLQDGAAKQGTAKDTGQGQARAVLSEEEPEPERMTYREYINHDRQQAKLHDQARRERERRRAINGADSDEELQLAMALSLSESQAAA